MRRPVPRRSASAPPYPTLDRRQKFALFGSILGIALVGIALPQLVGFLSERGDVLSGVFPAASAEASPGADDRSGFGGFVADPSSSPTPTPSASVTPAPTPTPGGTLVGPFQPGNPAGPTGAPLPTRSPAPTTAPTTGPPPATPPPPPSPPPTAPPATPVPTATPVATSPPSAEPTTPEVPPVVPPSRAQCSDGVDNDGDGGTDTGLLGVGLLFGDPHCSSPSDPSESS